MNKRLIVIFSILIFVVLIIILTSAIFTLQKAEIYYYNEDGSKSLTPAYLTSDAVVGDFFGKSIFFLSEQDMIDSINAQFGQDYVIQIVRIFPNSVQVHMAKRNPVFYIMKDSISYLIDVFGYVVSDSATSSLGYVDITNLAEYVATIQEGAQVTWASDTWTSNFALIRATVNQLWQHNFNYNQVYLLVDEFSFDADTMTILTDNGASIVIKGVNNNLAQKIDSSIGVYYYQLLDTTTGITQIIVNDDGKVITNTQN
ncbi:MAG: hypothetical protein PHW00_06415 [Clostridia bacterium]|nr:hypothetical protein [Clostridia bacterium]MDD3832265.1 hypothetical protein [Clostridia bacterium]